MTERGYVRPRSQLPSDEERRIGLEALRKLGFAKARQPAPDLLEELEQHGSDR